MRRAAPHRTLSRMAKDVVYVRQLGQCAYCLRHLDDAFEVDHLNECCTLLAEYFATRFLPLTLLVVNKPLPAPTSATFAERTCSITSLWPVAPVASNSSSHSIAAEA